MNDQLSRFPTDVFAEFDRLQQQLDQAFRGVGAASDIRATGRSTFPAVNVGGTDDAIEIIALAPGIDPAKVDITIEKGLLRISGERRARLPDRLGDRRELLSGRALNDEEPTASDRRSELDA